MRYRGYNVWGLILRLEMDSHAEVREHNAKTLPGKIEKTATAETLWIPSVNDHGGFGRWAFMEIVEPWDTQNAVRTFLSSVTTGKEL